jgi:phage regulator Rha-like protein
MTKPEKQITITLFEEKVINKIYIIRGQKVMLDRDLAEMYGVETKVLNQAVKRNMDRFPKDFMFKITKSEAEVSRSQIVTLKRGQNVKYLPFAFTEQGVAMLSSVLNSPIAIQVNIQIIRVFTKMKEILLTNKDILLKLERMERDVKENKKDIAMIFSALKQLLDPPQPKRKLIGFNRKDE